MASHRRSYHCFDAVADDSSRKASHSGHHRQPAPPQSPRQDPLEGGGGTGCNVCQSEGPVEAGGAQASGWQQVPEDGHHHLPPCRRPARPEEGGAAKGSREHHLHRHSKRILLVKNSDPSVRRTIVLHRRAVRSLGLFMDEVSELLQCHIRKLCTMEGRKVVGCFFF